MPETRADGVVTTGACFCGAIRWQFVGAPVSCDVCHCSSCRRAIGSHGVPWITVRRDRISIRGVAKRYATSAGVQRSFCPRCGTTLFYETEERPDEIDVTLGSAESEVIEPTSHTWYEDAAPWERRAHRLPRAARSTSPAPFEPATYGARTWLSPKATKGRPSAIAGRGVFATEPIAKGEVVEVKGGHVVDRATLRALPEHLQNAEIAIAEHLHLTALQDDEYEDVMLFINHCCEPNVGLRGNIVFVAMRDIAPGEELTVDYAMFDDDPDEAMTCNCGSPSCRETIRGNDWRRAELQERYGEFFSTHLLDKIRASRGD